MNRQLLKYLICPGCLPAEIPLDCQIVEEQNNDIISGTLSCSGCKATFAIEDGIAFLEAPNLPVAHQEHNKYEQEAVVSSYLWSHYGDLLADPDWSDAYPRWSAQITAASGLGIDLGAAVGRFTFELASKCDFAVGLDNSVAFIRTARKLMQEKRISVHLKDEGHIHRQETIELPEHWQRDNMEFIVADALHLPFRTYSASITSSLNLIDKLPHPLQHLQEMNRVCKKQDAQFLLSDPFSWSPESAPASKWLGGQNDGEFKGFGLDNVQKILTTGTHGITPAWREEKKSHVWWKIRTHRNHFELIRSCCFKGRR